MSGGQRTVDHLVVGAGAAGASCAAELRAMHCDGSIMLVGREPGVPYHRPAVTKSYLQGEERQEDILIRPDAWWQDNDIQLESGTEVVDIDLHERRALLSSGDAVRFDQALLATGASAMRLELPGAQLDGIHSLRTPADADALRAEIGEAESIVLIGGSYVACEVAASLAALGRRCTVLMLEDDPLQRTLGQTAARFLRHALEMHGVTFIGGTAVARFDGVCGHVRAVHTKPGRTLKADVVVVAIGAQPDVRLGRNAGLRLGRTGGLACDAFLRSAHPAVFCAGDVCEYDSVIHGRRTRFEYQNAAAEQGVTVAHNMLGERRAHAAVPYSSCELGNWLSLEYVGPAFAWDEEVVRGSIDEGSFTVWYLQSGRLAGALMIGRPQDVDHACSLVASHADASCDRATLADTHSDLAQVASRLV